MQIFTYITLSDFLCKILGSIILHIVRIEPTTEQYIISCWHKNELSVSVLFQIATADLDYAMRTRRRRPLVGTC